MKRRNARISFVGALIFFCTVAIAVTVAICIYVVVDKKSNGDRRTIAIVMLLVVLFLSLLFAIADVIRRRVMIDRPVEQILEATEKIAHGDFNVRLRPLRPYDKHDPYDSIMENVNALAKELGQTETLKTNFVANLSHELKTPLSVIRNYAQALQNVALDEETKKTYLQTLLVATEKLNALISNILKLNKLENAGLLPEKRVFRLDEQLAEIAVGFETAMERKNVTLDCALQEVSVYSSPELLEMVWNNLFSNAVKFTNVGGNVRLTVSKAGANVSVCVQDDGCGISPETGKRIFEKFYQGDTSHATEGNGLGLALVKKVIDTLGGEISVQSEVGKGSRFTVTLKEVVYEP
ncbi:MAG: HAMP domain-containing histidine kinase [Clostridiales bacterium]|nr:HAMP domain-containing histidine kinase [Clostridiales bacterium]